MDNNVKVPIWENTEEPLPEPKYMDLADRQAYKEAFESELNDLQNAALRSKQSALLLETDKKESQDASPSPQYPKKTPPEAPPAGPPEGNKH